jgi:hypothetical protein
MRTPGKDRPIITVMLSVLFVVGLLYKNWLGQIRDWIEAKVSQGDQPQSSTRPSGIGGSIEIGGAQPTVDGRTNAITGALLDPSRPIQRIGPLAGN